ncbi:MAG: hypothetical protein ACYSTZ_13010 [Planctomycetota bacterium]|jgi:hypothetical protein
MMSTASVSTGPGECIRLLDELERLLNDQIAMARKRNFDVFEELVEKSGGIVDELGRLGVCESSELKERFERLVKSYRTVVLSAAVEKDSLEKQLKQISQGRKTLRMYRGR